MKKLKAIFINAALRTITEVEVEQKVGSELQSLYRLIQCELVELVRLPDSQNLWVDEEASYKIDNYTGFFKIEGYPVPVIGNGVILSDNPKNGISKSTTLTVEQVTNMVTFYNLQEVRNLPDHDTE